MIPSNPNLSPWHEDEPVRIKVPNKDVFPPSCPPNCGRNCKQFYQAHTKVISFAMYATTEPGCNPREICMYAFSCGMEVEGEKFILREGEAPGQLLERVIPSMIRLFAEMAGAERDELGIRNN